MCASEKSLNFSIDCRVHWNVTDALPYRNFQRFFLSAHWLSKFWKNSLIIKIYTSVIIFQNFWSYWALKNLKKYFYEKWPWIFQNFQSQYPPQKNLDNVLKHSKIFIRRILLLKILKKFMVVYDTNLHVCEFFWNVWSYCALGKKYNWYSKLPIFRKFRDMQLPEFENR